MGHVSAYRTIFQQIRSAMISSDVLCLYRRWGEILYCDCIRKLSEGCRRMSFAGTTLHAMSVQTTWLATLHRPNSPPQAGLRLLSVGQERLARVPLTYLARTGCYDAYEVSGLHENRFYNGAAQGQCTVFVDSSLVLDKARMTSGVGVLRIGRAFSAGLCIDTVGMRSCGSSRARQYCRRHR